MAMESRILQAGGPSCSSLPKLGKSPGMERGQPGRCAFGARALRRSLATRRQSPSHLILAQARRDNGNDEGVEQRETLSAWDNQDTETFESTYVADSDSTSASIGSPLLWVGAGVGISVLFSMALSSVKEFAMKRMMQKMMGQMSQMSPPSPFGNTPMPPGAGFPFPQPPPASPLTKTATTPPDIPASEVSSMTSSAATETPAAPPEPRKPVFMDVSASTIAEQQNMGTFNGFAEKPPTVEPSSTYFSNPEVLGSPSWSSNGAGSSSSDGNGAAEGGTMFTVEALENMLEDPTVQKMVYPYLPEEMRNPSTFKWMMQNPQYRQQLQDMLNGMGGDGAWDSRMSDMLKNFDLNSTEVKQQIEQIGLTPEEVVGKIMANPDVTVAFQNPRVQTAIMDVSQNPLNISKYQNDKEVMDVFNKIAELFPGVTGAGSPY